MKLLYDAILRNDAIPMNSQDFADNSFYLSDVKDVFRQRDERDEIVENESNDRFI